MLEEDVGFEVTERLVDDIFLTCGPARLTAERLSRRQAPDGGFVEAEKRVFGDARTLYGRGGGVFGLAKLADRLMDTWMRNATLNANARVAPWTDAGQRQGFKFLVTQVRSMEARVTSRAC